MRSRRFGCLSSRVGEYVEAKPKPIISNDPETKPKGNVLGRLKNKYKAPSTLRAIQSKLPSIKLQKMREKLLQVFQNLGHRIGDKLKSNKLAIGAAKFSRRMSTMMRNTRGGLQAAAYGMFRRQKDLVQVAREKEISLRSRDSLESFKYCARSIIRAGVIRAMHMVDKLIQERMDHLKSMRELREQQEAQEKATREARLKYSNILATRLWDQVYDYSMNDGVKLVCRKRAYAEYLRLRDIRVVAKFEYLVSSKRSRHFATVLCKDGVLNCLVLDRVFTRHGERQEATLRIQCIYRQLIAKRELLILYLLEERKLFALESDHVLAIWKQRLKRAYMSIVAVETEQHRQLKQRIWARTEFSQAIGTQHFLRMKQNNETELPASIEAYQATYNNHTAHKLPSTDPTGILVAGENEAARLHWVGVPVAISESDGSKSHFKLVYQPVPASILGINLQDSRSRKLAQKTLEDLKFQADLKLEAYNHNNDMSHRWDEERHSLWHNESIFNQPEEY